MTPPDRDAARTVTAINRAGCASLGGGAFLLTAMFWAGRRAQGVVWAGLGLCAVVGLVVAIAATIARRSARDRGDRALAERAGYGIAMGAVTGCLLPAIAVALLFLAIALIYRTR